MFIRRKTDDDGDNEHGNVCEMTCKTLTAILVVRWGVMYETLTVFRKIDDLSHADTRPRNNIKL